MGKACTGKIKIQHGWGERGNPGSSAYSFCLRDDKEILIHAQVKPMGITTNMQVEIREITEVMTYCNECISKEVIIETDSLVAMKMIKSEWRIPWHLEEEIQHIQHIMQERNICIQHVFREAN